ncbi:unnamed protein product [Chrysodeixis includens]|uniref:L-dopachrome isomerase n=1 Tax=Chrysodeixis includens TaxID=689277 RepID=A0A9P0BKI1_CHRIL|nr:unnamed protein product [Chrysodeixis includens]
MPCLKILTNLPKSKIPGDFVNKIIPLLSKVVRKPEDNFICVISGDCPISLGGESASPAAVATLESIGHVGPQDNQVIAKEVSAFVENELGINKNNFFFTIYDLKPFEVVKGGLTVAQVWDSK